MTEDQQKDLESWARLTLGTVPQRRAPDELMRRVRNTLSTRSQPARFGELRTWPARWRLAAAALCVASLSVFLWFAAAHLDTAALRSALSSTREMFAGLTTILQAALLVLQKVGQPALLAALAVFAALAAFCAGVGTLCFRLVTTHPEI